MPALTPIFIRSNVSVSRWWLLLCVLASGILAFTPELKAQKNTPRIPEALSSKVEVLRGGRVQITLQGVTERIGEMEFMIRDQPLHGSLGQIQKTGPRSAVVTYQIAAQAGASVLRDQFTYAVKISGVSASSPAIVSIDIMDPRSELWMEVIETDTVKVATGEEGDLKVLVKNQGTGPAKVSMPSREAWEVVPREFELGAGKEQAVTLKFRPMKALDDLWGIQLDPTHDRGSLRVRGISYPPLVMTPPEVELKSGEVAGQQLRSAVVKVANAGDRRRQVTLSSADGLILKPDTVELMPNQVQEIQVELPNTMPDAGEGLILAKEHGSDREFGRVLWKAKALPLNVTLEPAAGATIDLGETTSLGNASLKIMHDQQAAVRFRFRTTGPFQVSGLNVEEGMLVPPQEGIELEIRSTEVDEGESKGTLHVEWNGGRADYDLRLMKKMAAPSQPTRQPGTSSTQPKPSSATPQKNVPNVSTSSSAETDLPPPSGDDENGPITTEVTPELNQRLASMHLAQEGISGSGSLTMLDLQTPQPQIEKFTTGELVLSWPSPEKKAHHFEVQVARRYLDKKLKIPVTEWFSWPGEVKLQEPEDQGGAYRVALKGYYPGRLLEFRLQAFDEEDRRWKPSETIRVTTPVRSWKWLYYTLTGLVLGGLSWIGWMKRRQKRFQHG